MSLYRGLPSRGLFYGPFERSPGLGVPTPATWVRLLLRSEQESYEVFHLDKSSRRNATQTGPTLEETACRSGRDEDGRGDTDLFNDDSCSG